MEPFEHEKDAAPRPSVRRTATMRCLIILSLMSFIFLLISLVFITLYLTARSDTSRADPQCSSTSQKYCGSQSCLLTAQGKIYCTSGHEHGAFDNAELLVTFYINYSPGLLNKVNFRDNFRAEN